MVGHLCFSMRTALEMLLGDLPDLCRSILPDLVLFDNNDFLGSLITMIS
jgi:hypothetical protein